MKKLLISLLLLITTQAQALHVQNEEIGIDIDTKKVSHIVGELTVEFLVKWKQELFNTRGLPGERVVVISSPGGLVSVADEVTLDIENERAKGVKMICAVIHEASSGAFNILSHCDVRLATRDTKMLAHKTRRAGMFGSLTARQCRKLANEIDKIDAPLRALNIKEMHVTPKEYDRRADNEMFWTAEELHARGYIHGFVKTETKKQGIGENK